MAILCISNGKNEKEAVKIIEDEVWKIDAYTTTLEDSNEVRIVNPAAYQNFQNLFPYAGRGSVRLFLPKRGGEAKEWLVFYRKHEIAFPRILLDLEFMEHYVEEGSRFLTYSDICRIKDYPSQVEEYMKVFCKKLIEKDRITTGRNNGGPLYYGFMRDILYRYLKYSKANLNAPSIDQLYAEYYSETRTLHDFSSSYRETSASLIPSESETDPDYLIYDEMDRVEVRYNKLHEFLSNPHFDRYYRDVFKDGYFFILGNAAREIEQKEIYLKWYNYGENGFDGTVVCPAAFKNSGYVDRFEKASIVFFIIFEGELEVERMISLALANQSEVAIQLYDASLYPKYAKKYPQATIFLASMKEEDELLDATDDFMIDCYNREKQKGYKK